MGQARNLVKKQRRDLKKRVRAIRKRKIRKGKGSTVSGTRKNPTTDSAQLSQQCSTAAAKPSSNEGEKIKKKNYLKSSRGKKTFHGHRKNKKAPLSWGIKRSKHVCVAKQRGKGSKKREPDF